MANPGAIRPGQRVRVVQTVARREGDWQREVVGEVLALSDEPTGSWYAHSRDDRLWLRRLRLRKDDGDVTTLALDQRTTIELLPSPVPARDADRHPPSSA